MVAGVRSAGKVVAEMKSAAEFAAGVRSAG